MRVLYGSAGSLRRFIPNVVAEARKYSALAIDTLVELTKDSHTDSTRFNAATALLDRGYGRPAQSLDLHLSADAITKRLSDMTDAELAALEARMITIFSHSRGSTLRRSNIGLFPAPSRIEIEPPRTQDLGQLVGRSGMIRYGWLLPGILAGAETLLAGRKTPRRRRDTLPT